MPFVQLYSDELHLGTSEVVFLELRGYDGKRHKTKPHFKEKQAKVLNRRL